MSILEQVHRNNKLINMTGITFFSSFMRKAFGQYPYDIESIEFSNKNLGKNIKKTIKKRKDPFIAIVRNNKQEITDCFLVPFVKRDDQYIYYLDVKD